MSLLQPESTDWRIKSGYNSDWETQYIIKWPQCMGRFVRYHPVTVTSIPVGISEWELGLRIFHSRHYDTGNGCWRRGSGRGVERVLWSSWQQRESWVYVYTTVNFRWNSTTTHLFSVAILHPLLSLLYDFMSVRPRHSVTGEQQQQQQLTSRPACCVIWTSPSTPENNDSEGKQARQHRTVDLYNWHRCFWDLRFLLITDVFNPQHSLWLVCLLNHSLTMLCAFLSPRPDQIQPIVWGNCWQSDYWIDETPVSRDRRKVGELLITVRLSRISEKHFSIQHRIQSNYQMLQRGISTG
jgi:hypothetical protein